jgi:hypothetical protein
LRIRVYVRIREFVYETVRSPNGTFPYAYYGRVSVSLRLRLDALKSKSAASAYQDTATESLDREADEEAGHTEDPSDSGYLTPDSLIGAAIFKVLNLQQTSKTVLTDIALLFTKLPKIIRHARSSPQRQKRWQEAVKTALPDSKFLMLILDVKTR